MIISPYETSYLKTRGIQSLMDTLTKMIIRGEVVEMVGYEAPREFDIYALVEPHEDIQVFYHPIPLDLPHRRPCIIYDARMFAKQITVSQGSHGKEGRITGVNESLNLLQITSVLMGIRKDTPNKILNVSDVPMTVYGSLLTETIARRLGLDPTAQLTMMATFQLFYNTRGYKTFSRFDDQERALMATSLSRKMGVDASIYTSIMNQMEDGDFNDFTSLIKFIGRMRLSPRLDKLSSADVYGMTMNSWVGQGNPRETMMLSLEFPPLFVAIVHIMSRNSFYQKMPIGQIVKRIDRGNNMKNFTQQLTYLLR